MLQDILKSRAVLWLLVKREFRTRYAGSSFGVFWNLIHPIVLVATYIIVFSQLMGSRMGGGGAATGSYAYLIHLTSGIVPWLLFSEVLNRSCGVLLDNGGMLKKMALPEEILFLSVFITSLVIYGISLVALIVLLMVLGVPFSPSILFVFPVMFALGICAAGIGMLCAVMNLLVRDVGQFVAIALQIGFWALPIVYPAKILPDTIQNIAELNPLYGYFGLIQTMFGSPDAVFSPDSYATMILLPFLAVLAGTTFLRSKRAEILDAL